MRGERRPGRRGAILRLAALRHGAWLAAWAAALFAAGQVQPQAEARAQAPPVPASRYAVRLATVPIDGAMRATVTGEGRAAGALDGRRLEISGSFAGMQGPVTAARLHSGPATGVRGAPIAELSVDGAQAGTVSGAVELTRDQLEALAAGRFYIQIHSESAPDGNLWGWLLP